MGWGLVAIMTEPEVSTSPETGRLLLVHENLARPLGLQATPLPCQSLRTGFLLDALLVPGLGVLCKQPVTGGGGRQAGPRPSPEPTGRAVTQVSCDTGTLAVWLSWAAVAGNPTAQGAWPCQTAAPTTWARDTPTPAALETPRPHQRGCVLQSTALCSQLGGLYPGAPPLAAEWTHGPSQPSAEKTGWNELSH